MGPRWEVGVEAGKEAGYPVVVGPGVLEDLPLLLRRHAHVHRYALIADARVHSIHGDRVVSLLTADGVALSVHTFPAGEERKTRAEWERLTDELVAAGVGRDGCVIALGGGVAGDLAGFVAATYMRGIPVVQIPTSLVAMADASVGGKTGVDLPSGKNLVGAFHPPRFVLADTNLTSTLPRAERSQGLAEALKHGAILDAEYFRSIVEEADALLGGAPLATAAVVTRSVELKASVVSRDEKEVGLRQILNFGHTLGHALETASQYRLPHGNAVAIGMVLEARLGERMGVTRAGVADEIAAAVGRIGLSGDPAEAVDTERLLALVSRDKKVREGVARYVLLRDLGTVDPGIGWSHAAAPELVREVLLEAAPEAL
ncbi:MAG: 3-dehydroquinate synthase [Gemmatimonadota bacterium]